METATHLSSVTGSFDAIRTPVNALTVERLLVQLRDAVEQRAKRRVIFCNVSTVVACRQDSELASAISQAQIVSPDGMPLVWLARMKGIGPIERVDGPTFIKTAMRYGVEMGWRHYLYGGSPKVLSRLTANLEAEIPGLQIAGGESPPFHEIKEDELTASIDRMNTAEPDLVWVGLGMPKQELWMARHQASIDAPVLLGVGAAFDFHAGVKKRAPDWMRRMGLEWSHRLIQEPRRLWRRYLVGNSLFVYFLVRDLLLRPLGHSRRLD